MEKKTLGTFLAALRKANGLTQKQLAEKLNVSDKTVSRWERDESAPDLTLIPVIAEIFGITSDELLRGQRATSESCSPSAPGRAEKQLRHLLKITRTRFQIHSAVAIAIALVGLIAAMIGNCGFLRAYIGFLAGCIFFVAALVCEAIFLIQGLSSLSCEEFDPSVTESTRHQLIRGAELVSTLVICIFAFCLPLVILIPDTYMGLQSASWIASGLLFAAIAAVLLWAVTHLINIKLGIVPRPDLKSPIAKLRIRCIKITLIFILCLGIGHICLALFLADNPHLVTDHRVFETLEDFKAYMETPTTYEDGSPTAQLPIADSNADGFSNLTAEDALEELYAHIDDTEPLLTFHRRNHAVTHISFGDASNDLLPIYTMTAAQVHQANRRCELICAAYCIFYIAALSCMLAYYMKRRKTI